MKHLLGARCCVKCPVTLVDPAERAQRVEGCKRTRRRQPKDHRGSRLGGGSVGVGRVFQARGPTAKGRAQRNL